MVPSGPGFITENNLRLFNTLIYSAQHKISICSPYFVPDDSLLYAVTTAAQRGVDVELFVSEKGDQFLVHHAQQSYYEALLEAGVRIYLYKAPFVLHAKHFTIDDEVAVLGSSNMDMRSFSLNLEVSVMLLGADIVRQDACRGGHLPGHLPRTDARRLDEAAHGGQVRGQRRPADGHPAVGLQASACRGKPAPSAERTPKALVRISSYSSWGEESAVMAPPTPRLSSAPPAPSARITRVRMATARSMAPLSEK